MPHDIDAALDAALALVEQLRTIRAAQAPLPVTLYRSASEFAAAVGRRTSA